ncbi:MAG TPA: beta-ketoacyl-ACP synthase II [Acidobacteriota bacterium]|nr:beta-ketoacyl-ACP synthase II [Acidobacteriota bacterium]HPB27586.1 beta-ketoacyl-ACP synthase II [Acidobacteriota bacterium]HQO24275.1 beta-ketoacyl-ACP synthase II [Acidobacteriota bacterium]
MRNDRTRVVITGMGMVSPLGLDVASTWAGLVAGRSGVDTITLFDSSTVPVHIAGEVKGFDPAQYMNFKEARRMARVAQLAIAAAREALADAGLPVPVPDEERTGTAIGVGMGGLDWAMDNARRFWDVGMRGVSPFAITSTLPNMPSYHVSYTARAMGPITTPVAACASGVFGIGEAAEYIRRGKADVMIAGGAEAMVSEIPIAGFSAMGALSKRNDEPQRASRPFDAARDGFVMAEGAAVVILEKLEHAVGRGARVLAEVGGFACSSDAYHITQPDPEGMGAQRTIRWALEDAGVSPADVDYINAHGTSTLLNDAIESRAIRHVFGERAYKVPVSSSKSMFGHALGAAGAMETVATVRTILDGIIHPTINLENPDPQCDLDYVPGQARQATVRLALKNSFGFGGQNACLVLSRFEQ